MTAFTILVVCVLFLVGGGELALAARKGIPGGRVGGGTRCEQPRQPYKHVD
ncbi:hypothetical protein J5X98_25480 [Leptothermofonsia sichuanensis E412]|jgi:hypothetical protein|uniref:hypothetical protein n=1 Tax=Leptothermofonsia sichuanensis TaxID=2917832 RepID=UPI001CA6C100|nr:hypothetical protein [Leptothermofonsia sichuanensis]QZZ20542.1 hypothetical protein J5X98_25480 [Leptothermofonsia sichuanensis E412]